MRRNRIQAAFQRQAYASSETRFGRNVENFKRRHALPPMPPVSGDLKFFQRILNVRKVHELIFITKTVAKNR